LSAVTFAKLEARQQNGNCDQAFSMASLKRRAFNEVYPTVKTKISIA
jgi:hypothetical protein